MTSSPTPSVTRTPPPPHAPTRARPPPPRVRLPLRAEPQALELAGADRQGRARLDERRAEVGAAAHAADRDGPAHRLTDPLEPLGREGRSGRADRAQAR